MAITYSISGGADSAKFNIDAASGKLTFKTAPDFETPGDANRDNIYEVQVKATDAGGASSTQDIRVTVKDVAESTNQPPQITSVAAISVSENQTTVLTVTANDPDEAPPSGGGTSGDIPLSWNDPRFNTQVLTQRVWLNRGQNLSNKSYSEQSGEPTLGSDGDNIIDTVRINSRECVRISGNGSFTYQNCYFEAKGTGSDHVDGLQAYAPGSRGSVIMRNTCVRAYNQAATAGLFVADNWTGTIDLKDVVFWGGPYGLRVHPDSGGDNILILENVYFVGPFGSGPFLLSDYAGHKNVIQKWTNVCNATISNGVLTPGSPIAKP